MQIKEKSNRRNPARKQLIMEAAIICFIENGYNQTGVRDIAKEAGISLGNVYNHFSGKDALLLEIAELESEELKQMDEILGNLDDPKKTMVEFSKEYLIYASRSENALLGLEILGEAVRNPAVEGAFSANRKMLETALCKLLKAGVKMEVFRNFSNLEETSKLILELIEGKALRNVLETTSEREQSDQIEIARFINNALVA